MIEVTCEACGWQAATSQPVHDVWAEHAKACPAVGGAVRYVPELPPLPTFLPEIRVCEHRLVRRQIAVTAAGVKRYAVVCELCGRRLGDPQLPPRVAAVIREAVGELEREWSKQLGPKRFAQLRTLLVELNQPS